MSVVDTFGRLPNEVLKSIINIYMLPVIDIVELAPKNMEMQIKYQMLTVNIAMIPSLVNYVDRNCIIYYNAVENNNYINFWVQKPIFLWKN